MVAEVTLGVWEWEPGSPEEASGSDSVIVSPRMAAGSPWTGSYGQKQSRETQDSSDEIMQTGEELLQGVIQEEVERSGDPQVVALSQKELGGAPQSPPGSDTQRLIECVRRIGDELDQNSELQGLMKKVKGKSPQKVFYKVATGIFADGKFSWGRVITLLYITGKLAVKALCQKISRVVKTIVGCAMEFLGSRLLGWIKAQGGWKSLLAYFDTTDGNTVAVVAVGALVRAFIRAFTRVLLGALIGGLTGGLVGALIGALIGGVTGGLTGGLTGALTGALAASFTTKKIAS